MNHSQKRKTRTEKTALDEILLLLLRLQGWRRSC
jgi:hypothetical protein